MSYLVLARKYRPQTFADVVGQEVIIDTLTRALTSGRVAHAYLLTGSRGVGKTTVARLMAKALVCQTGITPMPCGTCTHCREVTAGSSLDVIEIDGASNTGVDDVRELREAARYQPSNCRFKIFIIDEVHMLSTNAFNALLKILEEPPPHVKFVFATTEPHKIPITILSRCQRYDFKRIPTKVIVEKLQAILALENLTIDASGLMLIAQSAEGGMRDALSLTDQVISFSPERATLHDVTQILGLMDRKAILCAVDALIQGNVKDALDVVANAHTNGFDLKQLIDKVAGEFRNLAIAASAGGLSDLADLSQEDIDAVAQKAQGLDKLDLQRLFAMSIDGIEQVARSEQPRLALELTFLRMADRPSLQEAMHINEAIAKLEALASSSPLPLSGRGTKGEGGGSATDSIPSSATQATTLTLNPSPAERERESKPLSGVDSKWLSFVDAVTQQSPLLGHHLEHGRVAKISSSSGTPMILLEFTKRLHFQSVLDARAEKSLRDTLAQHYGQGARLEPVLAATATSALTIDEARNIATQKAQDDLEAKTREDPTIQKALSMFGGEIRSVKKISQEPAAE